jgi:leucyl-tRNA synthetase
MLTVAAGTDEKTLEQTALADTKVRELLAGKQVKKVIVARGGKLVNVVVG